MGDTPNEIHRIVPRASILPTKALRVRRRLRDDWRKLRGLARKAHARVHAAPGLPNKLREIRWLLRKAAVRLKKKIGPRLTPVSVTHAPYDPIARSPEENFLPGASSGAACAPIAPGVFMVALEHALENPPVICVRDDAGNLHEGRIVESEPADFQASSFGTTQFVFHASPELSQSASVDVLLHTSVQQVVFEGVDGRPPPTSARADITIENNRVRFEGRNDGNQQLGLSIFVDGKLSLSCMIAPRPDGAFSGAMVLDHRYLDGRPHLIELRQMPDMAVLASRYEMLSLHLTPWDALQTYARGPLDGTLSPQARHHFRGYREWIKNQRIAEEMPPLDSLYNELVQGFRKRQNYPPLAFRFTPNPVVSIVIPAHNKFEVTYHCLCSLLFAYNDTPFEVIIVDDGSTDETARVLEFVDGIRVIRRSDARGFVHACNDGAEAARGEFVLLLNNDTQVTTRWLDELVSAFRNFDNVGLVGSKLVYPDGRLQEAGGVVWGSGNPWNVGRDGNPEDPRYNYLRQVDYVSGAALMIPRLVWQEVGGFSAEFVPAYFEDTDLAMKVRESGRFIVYVPTSTVYHFEGQSAGTSVASGMKAYQEVNRPKFRRKWPHIYRKFGPEGEALDREKDRNTAFRVLFIDHQFPLADMDAGSYSNFQELRLFRALGAKVTFLPRNLAWMDRHTLALQRIGVECLYAPYVTNFLEYLHAHAADYDVVYVCRYRIAEQVVPLVKAASRRTKVIFNLADLHFLRELREAAARSPGYTKSLAQETRRAELAVVAASDLTFSYSDMELSVLERHVAPGTRLGKMPWIVECRERRTGFSDTRDLLFLGSISHHPNASAVRFFTSTVLPLIRRRFPRVIFNVVGSGTRTSIPELMSESVHLHGYVPDLEKPFAEARVFVAPLLAGAGVKGKVLDAISHGTPSVLSPIAVEGTGLVHGVHCLVAETVDEWVEAVAALYTDENLWNQISRNALDAARTNFDFDSGVRSFEADLARIGISSRRNWGLPYRHARPDRYGH
ncbi:MAG TPA: glycosyltransferase [Rhizomicrobium sp.]|jgi:GT2 family glycosyltransferase